MDEKKETLRKDERDVEDLRIDYKEEENDVEESEVKNKKKKLTPEEEMEIVKRVRSQTRSEYADMSSKSQYNATSSIVIMILAVMVLFIVDNHIMTSTRTSGGKMETRQTTEQSADRAGSDITDSEK